MLCRGMSDALHLFGTWNPLQFQLLIIFGYIITSFTWKCNFSLSSVLALLFLSVVSCSWLLFFYPHKTVNAMNRDKGFNQCHSPSNRITFTLSLEALPCFHKKFVWNWWYSDFVSAERSHPGVPEEHVAGDGHGGRLPSQRGRPGELFGRLHPAVDGHLGSHRQLSAKPQGGSLQAASPSTPVHSRCPAGLWAFLRRSPPRQPPFGPVAESA